ncbi:hydrogen gas-evolving membrane-bound hydrogenase subunit E [Pontibacter sp. CAU 1760]
MILLLLIGFLIAFLAPVLHQLLGRWVIVPLAAWPLMLLAYFGLQAPAIMAGESLTHTLTWVPLLGMDLVMRLDGLSLLFSLLITFFGTLILVYAHGYMGQHPLLGRFYFYLLLFMNAMLGVVLSDNIYGLFLFWELTSISSYLLIGFDQHAEKARAAAWQALLVTGGGGLAMFGGLLLLQEATGQTNFSQIIELDGALADHWLYLPCFILILLGCFTKSAQFPFHFWLPNAMAAPTPVSAYLHSATMVKAGIYLLARLTPVLSGTELWYTVLVGVGGFTALLGALLALQHYDLKAILAYTTISALGLMVTMLGIGTTEAVKAMLAFLLAHALYKGALFLVAGTIDHSTGTRHLPTLRGLGSSQKALGIAATLAALSMAGVIPFLGFISKETLYEASLTNLLVLSINILAGVAFVTVALLLSYTVFWKRTDEPTALQHPASGLLFTPPLLLGLTSLGLGLSASYTVAPALLQAAGCLLPHRQVHLDIALWHGFTPVFALSLLTLAVGAAVYFQLHHFRRLSGPVETLYRWGPDSLYQWAFKGFLRKSKAFIQGFQNGYLRQYIIYIIVFFISLMTVVLWRNELVVHLQDRFFIMKEVRLYELVLFVLMLSALLYILNTRSRLTSIVVMGLVGYSAALLYVFFGAPDVASTQLLIETLTVVIFVLMLHRLPAFSYLTHQYEKYKYITVAALFGILMTYVLLLVQQSAVDSELSLYYGRASYLQAHGKNIVNVILVDFRGIDTLGEITVLAVAAIGVFGLLNKEKKQKGGKP